MSTFGVPPLGGVPLAGPFASPPPTVSITTPTGGHVATASAVAVTWAYGSPISAPQVAYQIRVLDAAQTAAVFDSGIRFSSDERYEIIGNLPDLSSLWVEVSVNDGANWTTALVQISTLFTASPLSTFTAQARAAQLGSGSYRVLVRESMTGNLLLDVTPYVGSGTWYNSLNSPGQATVNLGGVVGDTDLAYVRPFAHEIEISRNGFPLFVGPITGRPLVSNGTATLTAQSMDAWFGVRFSRVDLAENAGLTTAAYLKRVVESSLLVNDPRLKDVVYYLTNTTTVSHRALSAATYQLVSEVFRDLIGTTTDYSVHGRRITYFPWNTSLGYRGSLLRPMIVGDFIIDRPAAGFASRVAVRAGSGKDETYTVSEGANRWGVLVERRVDASTNSAEVAAAKVTSDAPATTSVGTGAPLTLSPTATWRGETIECGMTLGLETKVAGDSIAVPMRITRVGATWAPASRVAARSVASETFQITVSEFLGSQVVTA